MNGSTRR